MSHLSIESIRLLNDTLGHVLRYTLGRWLLIVLLRDRLSLSIGHASIDFLVDLVIELIILSSIDEPVIVLGILFLFVLGLDQALSG